MIKQSKSLFNPIILIGLTSALIGSILLLSSFAALPNALQGDINGDSNVTITDLSALLADYGKLKVSAANQNADINNDGKIDIIDLSILLTNFGKIQPPANLIVKHDYETGAAGDYWIVTNEHPSSGGAGMGALITNETARSGNKSLKFTYLPNDPSYGGADRNQVAVTKDISGKDIRWANGQTRWFNISMKFSNDSTMNGNWCTLFSWTSFKNPPGSGALRQSCDGQIYKIGVMNFEDTIGVLPYPKGEFFDYMIGVRFSSTTDGWIEMYYKRSVDAQFIPVKFNNGQLRFTGQTLGTEPAYNKMGIYRDTIDTNKHVVYYDTILVAPTKQDILAELNAR